MPAGPLARLLAKSPRDPSRLRGEETLRGHTAMVLEAARQLLKVRLEAVGQAARLSSNASERLAPIVLLGCFIHDLGKCSEHFQQMLRSERTEPQLVRHEALSLWLCWPGQPLAAWLRPAVVHEADYFLALLAAAGHHRKFPRDACASETEGAGTSVTLMTSHRDFASTLDLGAKELGLPTPPRLADMTVTASRRGRPQD